jgi:hypothetical protein
MALSRKATVLPSGKAPYTEGNVLPGGEGVVVLRRMCCRAANVLPGGEGFVHAGRASSRRRGRLLWRRRRKAGGRDWLGDCGGCDQFPFFTPVEVGDVNVGRGFTISAAG